MIAPDGNRSRDRAVDHHPAADLGRGGRLRRRHGRLRDRRHAGRLRPLRAARPDRRLRGRPRRVRHQPRLQPRRRHHLLGHRGRGARGARARAAGHRGLAAVARARAGLPHRPSLRLRHRRGVHRAHRRGARVGAAARRARCSSINVPAGEPDGVEVTRLGKRIYRDELEPAGEEDDDGRRRQYRIYGEAPDHVDEDGTDLAAVAAGRIAVTPVHFDLTDREGMDALARYDLARLLEPAAARSSDVARE